MSGMLASVNCLEEALIAQQANVDIIDLKQPVSGALGALDTQLVREIVTALGHNKPVSATVGDLPMQADLIYNAVLEMADTGVDYIKIGFFPHQSWHKVIVKLQSLRQLPIKLIAVLFADQQPDCKTTKALSQAGFTGVMLDTMDKSKGSLTQVMPLAEIRNFVQQAKQHHLLCGLAGSLRKDDISPLLPLQADYLGFRGALCTDHQRTASLDPVALQKIQMTISTQKIE